MYGIVFILLYMKYMIVKLNLRFDNTRRFFWSSWVDLFWYDYERC